MERFSTFVFGVSLHLVPAEEGGRTTALTGGIDAEGGFAYRPNWGLPGMVAPAQTGGPVLGFSSGPVAPGDTVRAVVVALYPEMVPHWASVDVGVALPMYEGSRVCGIGRVLWREGAYVPLADSDRGRFISWLTA